MNSLEKSAVETKNLNTDSSHTPTAAGIAGGAVTGPSDIPAGSDELFSLFPSFVYQFSPPYWILKLWGR